MVASEIWVKYGWVLLWLPTGCPAWAIARTSLGKDLAKSPVTKKVAGTPFAFSVARMLPTPALSAPPSKVKGHDLAADREHLDVLAAPLSTRFEAVRTRVNWLE
jgi:hypothetical protein